MSVVLTIARASVTEHVRRKLILFFALIALIVTGSLAYLTFNRDAQLDLIDVVVGIGGAASLGLLPFITTLAAVAVSMNNIGRPFSDGEAMLILSRPVARWQYAAGRLLGSIAVVVGLCLFSSLLMQGVLLVDRGDLDPRLWGHWATTAFNLSILVSMTTLLSSLLNAPVLAAFISYFVYTLSGAASALYLLVTSARATGPIAAAIATLYYATPRKLTSPLAAGELNGASAGSLADAVALPSGAGLAVWAIAYMAIMLLLTFVVVQRKDL